MTNTETRTADQIVPGDYIFTAREGWRLVSSTTAAYGMVRIVVSNATITARPETTFTVGR